MQVFKLLSALLFVFFCLFDVVEARRGEGNYQRRRRLQKASVDKAALKAAEKKDKALNASAASAPSASPVAPTPIEITTPSPSAAATTTRPTVSPITTTTSTYPPVVDGDLVHKFTMIPTQEERISWNFFLQVDPPAVSKNALKEALEAYLGPTTARLWTVEQEETTNLFTVESQASRMENHEKAIHDQPQLQLFLQQQLNNEDLRVTKVEKVSNEDDSDKSSVSIAASDGPKRGLLVALIVSLFLVAFLFVSIMYIVPCLEFRKEREEEWTFSQEREATFMKGTSA